MIVTNNSTSGNESQKVDDLLDKYDVKPWIDGLNGSELIVVYITEDLLKFFKVMDDLFFHGFLFILSADTTHVVENGHHIIDVGGINLMLFYLSAFKSFLELLSPLYVKCFKFCFLLFLLNFLSPLVNFANFIKGKHVIIIVGPTVHTIEIPITI